MDRNDEAGWITEDAAIEWVMHVYGRPRDVAKVEAAKAVRTGLIRYRDTVTEMRDGKPVHIPPRLSLLGANLYVNPRLCGMVHDARLNEETFRWQIEQQLGKPPAPKAAGRRVKPEQAVVNKALLDLARARGRKVKQADADAQAALEKLGATTRQITVAFRALPAEYRYGRGSRPGKSDT